MNTREMTIWMYSGLTEAQWSDLEDAHLGKLQKINGARHQAMKDLIGDDLETTSVGEQLYQRVSSILNGDKLLAPVHEINISDTAKSARQANKGMVHIPAHLKFKLNSVHMKILRDLGKRPGLHFGYLTSLYGWQQVKELESAGLIEILCFDNCKRWGWYALDFIAARMLDELEAL